MEQLAVKRPCSTIDVQRDGHWCRVRTLHGLIDDERQEHFILWGERGNGWVKKNASNQLITYATLHGNAHFRIFQHGSAGIERQSHRRRFTRLQFRRRIIKVIGPTERYVHRPDLQVHHALTVSGFAYQEIAL